MKRLRVAVWCFFHAMKGGEDMKLALIFASYVIAGALAWEDVLDTWKPAVKYWLDAYGIGTDGKPLPKAE